MMRINLLADYRGVLTGEAYYVAGVQDIPDGHAKALIDAGRAEAVEPEPETPPEPPKKTTTRRTRAKKS